MRLVANFATWCLQPTWKVVVKMWIFPNQGWLWTYLKPIALISPLWRTPPLGNCSHGNRICEWFTWRPQKIMHLGWREQSLCHYVTIINGLSLATVSRWGCLYLRVWCIPGAPGSAAINTYPNGAGLSNKLGWRTRQTVLIYKQINIRGMQTSPSRMQSWQVKASYNL